MKHARRKHSGSKTATRKRRIHHNGKKIKIELYVRRKK